MNERKKILVVDDNNSIRTAIADLLSKKYTCSSAENFDHAAEFLEKEHFDLIITDIRMPGKSGLDLIEYAKSKITDTQYALITAYDINDYIHFAKNRGIWNIIPKYSSLDLNYITVMVDKLLYKDIFGPEKYFPGLQIIDSEKDSPFRPVQENC
ncbi:MAG TPA: response regulator, partial [Leptospiraceae bacterium]|nr:response regulator [Leptospiraceae bacterium]